MKHINHAPHRPLDSFVDKKLREQPAVVGPSWKDSLDHPSTAATTSCGIIGGHVVGAELLSNTLVSEGFQCKPTPFTEMYANNNNIKVQGRKNSYGAVTSRNTSISINSCDTEDNDDHIVFTHVTEDVEVQKQHIVFKSIEIESTTHRDPHTGASDHPDKLVHNALRRARMEKFANKPVATRAQRNHAVSFFLRSPSLRANAPKLTQQFSSFQVVPRPDQHHVVDDIVIDPITNRPPRTTFKNPLVRRPRKTDPLPPSPYSDAVKRKNKYAHIVAKKDIFDTWEEALDDPLIHPQMDSSPTTSSTPSKPTKSFDLFGINKAANTSREALDSVVDAVKPISDAIANDVMHMDTREVAQAGAAISDSVEKGSSVISQNVQSFNETIKANIKIDTKHLETAATAIGDSIKKFSGDVVDLVTSFKNVLVKTVPNLAYTVVKAIAQLGVLFVNLYLASSPVAYAAAVTAYALSIDSKYYDFVLKGMRSFAAYLFKAKLPVPAQKSQSSSNPPPESDRYVSVKEALDSVNESEGYRKPEPCFDTLGAPIETQVGEANPDEDGENVFVSVLYLFAGLFQAPDAHQLKKDTNRSIRVRTYLKGITDARSGITALLELSAEAVNYIKIHWLGYPADADAQLFSERLSKFFTDFDAFTQNVNEAKMGSPSSELNARLKYFYDEITYLILNHPKYATQSFPTGTLNNCRTLLVRWLLLSNGSLSGEPYRVRPVIVNLYGPAGIGKSVVIQRLIARLSKLDRCPFGQEQLYSKPAGDYWSGYHPGVRYVVFEDPAFLTDPKERDALVSNIMSMGNDTKWPLNMAELAEKKNTFFEAHYVFMSNNTGKLSAFSSAIDHKAVNRRVDFNVEVQKLSENFDLSDFLFAIDQPDDKKSKAGFNQLARALSVLHANRVDQLISNLKEFERLQNIEEVEQEIVANALDDYGWPDDGKYAEDSDEEQASIEAQAGNGKQRQSADQEPSVNQQGNTKNLSPTPDVDAFNWKPNVQPWPNPVEDIFNTSLKIVPQEFWVKWYTKTKSPYFLWYGGKPVLENPLREMVLPRAEKLPNGNWIYPADIYYFVLSCFSIANDIKTAVLNASLAMIMIEEKRAIRNQLYDYAAAHFSHSNSAMATAAVFLYSKMSMVEHEQFIQANKTRTVKIWEALVSTSKLAYKGVSTILDTLSKIGMVFMGTALCLGLVNTLVAMWFPTDKPEPQSITKERHEKPKKIDVIIAHSGNSSRPVVNKIAANTVQIAMLIGGERLYNCWAIGICSTWMIAPKHVFILAQQSGILWQLEVVRMGNSGVTKYVLDPSQLHLVYVHDSDVAFVKIELKGYPQWPIVINHFIVETDLVSNLRSTKLVLSEFDHIGGAPVHRIRELDARSIRLVKNQKYNLGDTEVICVGSCLVSEVVAAKGDCGGFYYADNDLMPRKLVGIHTAGSPNFSYCSIVTQSMIMRHITEPQMSSVVADNVGPGATLVRPALYRKRLQHHSKIVESPIHGVFEVTKAPAILAPTEKEGEMIYPMMKSIKKYTSVDNQITPRALTMLEEVVEQIKIVFPRVPYRVLTWDEVLNGSSESLYLKPMNVKTASGYIWDRLPGGKKAWLRQLPNGKWEMSEELAQEVFRLEEKLASGDRETLKIVFSMFLKDETLPLEKVKNLETRPIFAPPFPFQILTRKYFGWYIAQHLEQHNSWMTIGLNPHDKLEWTNQHDRMGFGWKKIIDADVKGFSRSTMEAAQIPCHKLAVDVMAPPPSTRTICESIMWCLRHKGVHVIDSIVEIDGRNPDGHGATGWLNCVQILAFNATAYSLWLKDTQELHDPGAFLRDVTCITHGDDNVQTVHPQNPYNFLDLKKYIWELGLEVTPAIKTNNPQPYVTLSNLQFLKRGWRKDPDCHYFHAPLDLETITNMCNWLRQNNHFEETFRQVLRAVAIELMHHGLEVYNKHMGEIQRKLIMEGFDPFTETNYYQAYSKWLVGQISYDYETTDPGYMEEDDEIMAQSAWGPPDCYENIEYQSGKPAPGTHSMLTTHLDGNIIKSGTIGVRPSYMESGRPYKFDGAEVMHREYEIRTIPISNSMGPGDAVFSCALPSALFAASPFLQNMITQWGLFRADCDISVRMQSTVTHTGSMVVAVVPSLDTDYFSADAPYSTSLYPNRVLSYGNNASLNFKVCYQAPKFWLRTSEINGDDAAGIASLFCYVQQPLVTALTSGTNIVSVGIYAKFSNFQWMNPTINSLYTSLIKPHATGPSPEQERIEAAVANGQTSRAGLGFEEDQVAVGTSPVTGQQVVAENTAQRAKPQGSVNPTTGMRTLPVNEASAKTREGDVSGILGTVSAASNILSRIPVIGPVFSILSGITHLAHSAATVSGHSKTVTTETVERIALEPAPYHAQGDGAHPAKTFSLTMNPSTSNDPLTLGETEDLLSFQGKCGHMSLVHTMTFDTSAAKGTILGSIPISPMVCHQTFTSGTAYTFLLTHMAHAALLYNSWRGGIKITAVVCMTQFSSVRLKFSWLAPEEGTVISIPAGESDHLSVVKNIDGDTTVHLEFPYACNSMYLATGYPLTPIRPSDAGQNQSNGTLAVSIEGPLVTSQTGVSSSVSISFYIGAGSGFELYRPRSINSLPILWSKYPSSVASKSVAKTRKATLSKRPPPKKTAVFSSANPSIKPHVADEGTGNLSLSSRAGNMANVQVMQAHGINNYEVLADLRTLGQRWAAFGDGNAALTAFSISDNGTFNYRWDVQPQSNDLQYLIAGNTWWRGKMLFRLTRMMFYNFVADDGTYQTAFNEDAGRTVTATVMTAANYSAIGGDTWFSAASSDYQFIGFDGCAIADTSKEPTFTLCCPFSNVFNANTTHPSFPPLVTRPSNPDVLLITVPAPYGLFEDTVAVPVFAASEAFGDDLVVGGREPPGYVTIRAGAYPYPYF